MLENSNQQKKTTSKVQPALPAKKTNWQALHVRDAGLGDF